MFFLVHQLYILIICILTISSQFAISKILQTIHSRWYALTILSILPHRLIVMTHYRLEKRAETSVLPISNLQFLVPHKLSDDENQLFRRKCTFNNYLSTKPADILAVTGQQLEHIQQKQQHGVEYYHFVGQ